MRTIALGPGINRIQCRCSKPAFADTAQLRVPLNSSSGISLRLSSDSRLGANQLTTQADR
jgi:hypothetical protein